MDPSSSAAAVAAERRALADFVSGLSPEQWSTQSLCAAWTVRDVIAHLTTTTRLSVGKVLLGAVRARGSFDRMEEAFAAERTAAHSDEELVALLRESAESTRRFPGSGPMDPLMDLVIHAQDVARPLATPYASPPEVVTACLEHVAGNKLMGGPKRLAGIALVADSGLRLGAGVELRGPDVDLLLVAAGRPAGLAALSGPGLELVAGRVRGGGSEDLPWGG